MVSTVLERRPEVVRGGEADLIAPVLHGASELLLSIGVSRGTPTATFLEVPCEYGVIDVVHVVFDPDELTRREQRQLSAVPERRHVLTLHALAAGGGRMDVDDLATAGRISAHRLRKVVGPELERRGWVRSTQRSWTLTSPVRTSVTNLLAVEIKQTDLSRGLAQARRYASAAEHVTLAVGPDARADRAAATFQDAGIGLAHVRGDRIDSLVAPAARPDFDPLARISLSEQVLQMRERVQHSGPVREVFGRMLLSEGHDPRLTGAAGYARPAPCPATP